MPPDPKSKLAEVVESSLESARVEVCRRLANRELPTTVTSQRLVVRDKPDGTSESAWHDVRRSPVTSIEISLDIRDESVPGRRLGLREQLLPLAELLDETTDLGQAQPWGLYPDATGPDAVLTRVVVPVAHEYLASLDDIAVPDATLVRRLASELEEFTSSDEISRTHQLVLGGVSVPAELLPYRGVELRPLSGEERGAIAELTLSSLTDDRSPDFIVPRRVSFFNPTALLSATTARRRSEVQDRCDLIRRMALALILSGFDISATGIVTGFDVPRWASMGMTSSPFPVQEKTHLTDRTISQTEFEGAVDLAHKMPAFGPEERDSREIALDRVLRGSGVRNGGFLDFAIALEAALLREADTELSYRFALYGALFLADERDPIPTFEQLRHIYKVRSRIVHGASVKSEDRQLAEQKAAELAKAVMKRAIESGWPKRSKLDEVALKGAVSPLPADEADA